MTIKSFKGEYSVDYCASPAEAVQSALSGACHVIIDKRVFDIYRKDLKPLINSDQTIEIEASETAKTIDNIVPVMEALVENNFRRDQSIVAIGGGVVQDITCFIASVMMRGVNWRFVPTTLLAQADSCIGSKSSVNLKRSKNTLGTFYPPESIHVSTRFLKSLPRQEIQSGIGEIIKVHAIDGKKSYDYLAARFDDLERDDAVLGEFVGRSLEIKKKYIEIDEFDRGPRNIFNFGHSFGHAIETATNYQIPHGIAVTIGMNIALDFAVELGRLPTVERSRMRPIMLENAADYLDYQIDGSRVFKAMARDKKNTQDSYRIIIPEGKDASISTLDVKPDGQFEKMLNSSLKGLG